MGIFFFFDFTEVPHSKKYRAERVFFFGFKNIQVENTGSIGQFFLDFKSKKKGCFTAKKLFIMLNLILTQGADLYTSQVADNLPDI